MQEIIRDHMKKLKLNRRRRRIMGGVLAVCAVLVAGVVLWQLMIPGVAWSGEPTCGIEEHTHDEGCYEDVLTCGMEEAEAHVHSAECYQQELICGQDEGGEHTHTAECYQEALICGKEENSGHVHTADCYTHTQTCAHEEHTHTAVCYADPSADIETEEEWTAAIRNITFTEDWGGNVTAVANSQLGYTESEKNYQVTESGEQKGYTRYGAWGGSEYADWDVLFAAFCLNYAELPEGVFPVDTDLDTWVNELGTAGLYGTQAETVPEKGDLIILQKTEQETEKQIGIITKVEESDGRTYITAVEGNCENGVKENTYDLIDGDIAGYGLLHQAEDAYKNVGKGTETSADAALANGTDAAAANGTETPGGTGAPRVFSTAGLSSGSEGTPTETLDQRLTLNVIAKGTGTGENGVILYANVSATNSNPNDVDPPSARVDISELPEGITLAGFEQGQMKVGYKSQSGSDDIIIVYLKTDDTTGNQYIEFTPPAGATVTFDLQFNSQNGIMNSQSKVIVTPSIPDRQETDIISGPAELTWSGQNIWENLKKTVDQTLIPVDGGANKLQGILNYTITANNKNADGKGDTGAIWTKEVILTDTLTLSEGISFPADAEVSGDKIVDGKGKVIFQFTELQGGYVEKLNISPDRKEAVYRICIPNQYLENQVPTEEQDHLNVKLSLDMEKLLLRDNYVDSTQAQVDADKITNKVDIKTTAYKGDDTYIDTKEVVSKPVIEEKFSISKSADKTEAKPGETIEYKITIKNTGVNPIKGKDDEGNKYEVTDTLPEYLVLTQEQIKAIEASNGTYDEKTRKITWRPGDIGIGETKKLSFKVNVADAETMAEVANDTEIKNEAAYKGKTDGNIIIYKKPEIVIEKHSNHDGEVSNGDLITYTITVENKEDTKSIEQVLNDTLQNGLEFQYMLDSNNEKITESGTTFKTESTTAEKDHDVTFKKDGQNLSWELGSLAAKEKVTLKLVCKVNTDAMDKGSAVVLKNKITEKKTGEGSNEDEVTVDYPIDIDKKVNGTNGGETYENGTVLNYSIKISNAEGDEASNKDDLVLTDQLPAGIIPSDCVLYRSTITTDLSKMTQADLIPAGLTWEEYLNDLDATSWKTYYTIINGEIVGVSKQWGTAELRSAKLTWYIGKLDPGQAVTKNYKAKIYMTDSNLSSGNKVTYTNTAIIEGKSSSVTVYGEANTGSIRLIKYLTGLGDLKQLTEEEKQSITFRVTCVDENGDPLLKEGKAVYEKDFSLADFKFNVNQFYLYIKDLPFGEYKVEETNPGQFDKLTATVNINGKEQENVKVELSREITHEDVTIKNTYLAKSESTVDLQKSVWSIIDQRANKLPWEINPIRDKYLFSKSKTADSGAVNCVIYNISIVNTGNRTVRLSELKDQMAGNLQFIGISKSLMDKNFMNFTKAQIETNSWAVGSKTSLKASNVVDGVSIKVKDEGNEGSVNTVTFVIGQDTGYDLLPGKAISFFVKCQVNDNAELGVPLTNKASLIVDESVLYKGGDTITMKGTKDDKDQNNGDTKDEGVEDGKRTISSAVDVIPKDMIVPGITKKAESYIPAGQTVQDEVPIQTKDNIQPNVTVKWKIQLFNDGTVPIKDYTIRDSVQKPFHILSESEAKDLGLNSGSFVLTIYTADGSVSQTADLSQEVWQIVTDDSRHEFSIDIKGIEKQIPPNGSAALTVYTRNTEFANSIYENTATFSPEESFEATYVKHGEIVSDTNGTVTGVKASDSVYALGEYGSFSWKTIEEKGDESNKGWGYLGQEGKNYISLDNETRDVTYTNNIENASENSFKKMTIIDMMPFAGDTGVLNQSENRDSEFSVTYADNLKLYVTSSGGNSQQRELIKGTDYTIDFSPQVSFTAEEMSGALSDKWHDKWQAGDKSFRIIMASDFELAPSEVLTIQYDGLISTGANPGELAWNSFAYQYTATNNTGNEMTLRAEPPKVGVKIYKKPTIEKEVVDASGSRLDYDKTKSFTFKAYSGDSTKESSLLATFEIHQGEALVISSIKDAEGNPVFKDGEQYTITEVVPAGYQLIGVGQKGGELTASDKYTFTYYERQDNISILFRNEEFGYELPETGGIGTFLYTLGGASLMAAAALLYGYRLRCKRKRRGE